jgi:hypothetical protein
MAVAIDWNCLLSEVGSGGGVDTLRRFGDLSGGVASRWSLIPLPVDALSGLVLGGFS